MSTPLTPSQRQTFDAVKELSAEGRGIGAFEVAGHRDISVSTARRHLEYLAGNDMLQQGSYGISGPRVYRFEEHVPDPAPVRAGTPEQRAALSKDQRAVLATVEASSTHGHAITYQDLERTTRVQSADVAPILDELGRQGLVTQGKFRDLDGTFMPEDCYWIEVVAPDQDPFDTAIQRKAEETFPDHSGPHALTLAMRETFLDGARAARAILG